VDPGAAGYLWARAGREVLELRCRGRGDVLTGEKWLPDRAARLGFDLDDVRACYRAGTEDEFRALLAGTGLDGWDPWELTTLRTDAAREPVRLGREEFALTRHGRLLADAVDADGTVAEVAGDHPPARLLAAVRDGELSLTVSDDALWKVLHD
jgi:hypothetical protein